MRSSRYISLFIPKAYSPFGRLSFQFSAANDWNELQKTLKLETYISLTNFKHQLSEQLTNHCTCTLPIQLPHPIIFYFFFLIAPQYLYLHIIFCTSITPLFMLNYNYFTTMAYLLPYLPNLTTFAHTVYSVWKCREVRQ